MKESGYYRSSFHLSKMDCSSEEAMVRMHLKEIESIQSLEFDLNKRDVIIMHTGDANIIKEKLEEMRLGLSTNETQIPAAEPVNPSENKETDRADKKRLWYVMIINITFFVIEMFTGFISRSMGLVADSLDMLADSLVYGLSLWAVGAIVARKKRVARLSGYFQAFLALFGLVEVIRRFVSSEEVPDYRIMIIVSFFALIANSISLYIIQRSRNSGVHMKTSIIFTANDVIINIGVMLAGTAVRLTNSKYPDLIIGTIVFIIVIRGALRILRLGKK